MNAALVQVFLVYGLVSVLFLYLGYKLISRKKSRLSYTVSLFYFITAISFFINIIQRVIDTHQINITLNPLIAIIGCFASCFLLLFNLMLSKSGEVISLRKEILILVVWGIIVSVLFLIPGGVEFTYKINSDGDVLSGQEGYDKRFEGDLGTPKWSGSFTAYILIVTLLLFIAIIYTGLELKKKMGESKFGKKFGYTIYGIILFGVLPFGTMIVNYINTNTARTIFLGFQVLIFPASWMIYVGLRQEDE